MTPQEAIEIITNAIQTDDMTPEQDKALAIVQKATYKQIPMKPKDIGIFTEIYVCPNCEDFLISQPKYCESCGQALDWGDEV